MQVGENEFGLDHGDVTARVDAAVDMDDVVIGEGADDLADGVGFADVGEEFVAQPFILGGAFHNSCDVNEANGGGFDHFRPENFGKFVQPWIGQFDEANVGFDGGEGIVRCKHIVACEGIKEGGLAHVWQANNSKS